MKKRYRRLLALVTGTMLILGASQGLAANTNNGKPPVPKDGLHRDGSAFVKETRITQADRQAAADRAKAKGFVAPMVGAAQTSAPPVTPASPGKSTQAKGVVK